MKNVTTKVKCEEEARKETTGVYNIYPASPNLQQATN